MPTSYGWRLGEASFSFVCTLGGLSQKQQQRPIGIVGHYLIGHQWQQKQAGVPLRLDLLVVVLFFSTSVSSLQTLPTTATRKLTRQKSTKRTDCERSLIAIKMPQVFTAYLRGGCTLLSLLTAFLLPLLLGLQLMPAKMDRYSRKIYDEHRSRWKQEKTRQTTRALIMEFCFARKISLLFGRLARTTDEREAATTTRGKEMMRRRRTGR